MHAFKLTSWNAEWLGDAFDVARGAVGPRAHLGIRRAPGMEEATARLDALTREIREIDPDIVCLLEAVPHSEPMQAFRDAHLPDYELITRPGPDDDAYDIRGDQWIWFLVKADLAATTGPHLLDIATWQAYAAEESRMGHKNGRWVMSVPRLDRSTRTVGANERKRHRHYRHPQTLVLDWQGTRVEFIGAHFKSKHIGMSVPRRGEGETDKDYFARDDVRWFMANALFDYPQNLRWTVRFQDRLDPARDPHILLDHIVFTEALSRRGLGPLIVHPGPAVSSTRYTTASTRCSPPAL